MAIGRNLRLVRQISDDCADSILYPHMNSEHTAYSFRDGCPTEETTFRASVANHPAGREKERENRL